MGLSKKVVQGIPAERSWPAPHAVRSRRRMLRLFLEIQLAEPPPGPWHRGGAHPAPIAIRLVPHLEFRHLGPGACRVAIANRPAEAHRALRARRCYAQSTGGARCAVKKHIKAHEPTQPDSFGPGAEEEMIRVGRKPGTSVAPPAREARVLDEVLD